MLGTPLESNAHDQDIVTQLLPAKYVPAAVELCHAKRLYRCRRAVHRECHFLFRDDRAELVETYWTGRLYAGEVSSCSTVDPRALRDGDVPASLSEIRLCSDSLGKDEMKASIALAVGVNIWDI